VPDRAVADSRDIPRATATAAASRPKMRTICVLGLGTFRSDRQREKEHYRNPHREPWHRRAGGGACSHRVSLPGTSDPGKSTAFRKSSVGGDKFSLGPSSSKNSEPIGSWDFPLHYAALSAALSAKPCCRSENSMITYATGVGRSVTAQWYTRLRYAQQPVSSVTYQHQEQSLWMPIS